MKKAGKINTPFRYDLNEIPNNYTVEVTKKLQGIISDRVSIRLRMEACNIVQEAVVKTLTRKRNAKSKMFV